jgi:hypothetical protein
MLVIGLWMILELKDFQTNPPSFDVKQTYILEKKQDLNIVFRSLLIEDGIMEIPLCCMISMQVVRLALTNDILKLQGNFYSSYQLGVAIFYVSFEGIDGCIVDVTLERTNSWDDHWKVVNDEFEEFLKSKPSLDHLMGKMFHVWGGNRMLQAWFPYINEVHAKNKSRHVQVASWMLDANMENHGALHSIMDGVNVNFFPLLHTNTTTIQHSHMLLFCGHIGQHRRHM